jgi:hypothetical protein
MSIRAINNTVTAVVALILAALASAAFVLSFDVLRQEAITYGVRPELAWIFPIVVDLSIVGGGAFVIWASINRLRALRYVGYGVVAGVTALSVALNRYHANGDGWLAITYMVVPPIALATMTYLCERMIEHALGTVEESRLTLTRRRDSRRRARLALHTLREQLDALGRALDISARARNAAEQRANAAEQLVDAIQMALDEERQTLYDTQRRMDTAERTVHDLRARVEVAEREAQAFRAALDETDRAIALNHITGERTQRDLAALLNVSPSTISDRKHKLNLNGATK